MPFSIDDVARLPPMIPHEEVVRKQQLDDLRDFRQYLVDTGMVKCLVKMFQHTAKHKLAIDSPDLVPEFLTESDECVGPDRADIVKLLEANATLAEDNATLEREAVELEKEVRQAQRSSVARKLWKKLTDPEFWDAADGDFKVSGLPASRLYERLCGALTERGAVLVDLIKPPGIAAAEGKVLEANALAESVSRMEDDLFLWCTESLIPALEDGNNPPFEGPMLEAIRGSEYYPANLAKVGEDAQLEPDLLIFLEAVAPDMRESFA